METTADAPGSGSPRIETVGRLSPSQVEAVTSLIDDATDVDGVGPLSEHVMLHLRYGGDQPARNLLLWHGETIAAYAHLDVTDLVEGPSAELVVGPRWRRHGYGRALISNALDQTGGRLRLWAHGGLPDAELMAERLGFRRVRALWQLRRSLLAPLPPVQLPTGVSVRTFVPGADDAGWLELNARAFAGHPEQGSWSIDDLRQRTAESWFDPAGFFLAERGSNLIGFAWTKVHGHHVHEEHLVHGQRQTDQPAHVHADEHGHEPIGEVYVVGVDPVEQGHGLGRELTVVGLRHLRGLGLHQVMLYADESNVGAIGLYESLGFSRWGTDVLFRRG